jgi:hypothetical protein
MKAILKNSLFLPLCAISMLLFVSSCDDDDELEIQYPETGFYGDNILMKGKTEYNAQYNSLQAKLPEGKKLEIVITGLSVNFPAGLWGIVLGTNNNWAISEFDMSTYSQTFQSIDGGHTCDQKVAFEKGTFRIDYYENDATTPSYSKTIVVNW